MGIINSITGQVNVCVCVFVGMTALFGMHGSPVQYRTNKEAVWQHTCAIYRMEQGEWLLLGSWDHGSVSSGYLCHS